MNGPAADLNALTRRDRAALRTLLVRTVATAGRERDSAELARLVAEEPVSALPAAAALHRVAGTVRRGLDGIDTVPPEVMDDLGAVRDLSARRHLLFTAALDQIGRAFDAADVSWVVMKGPVVALRYPEVGDRTYNDLDLLVHRRSFPSAVRILEELGYQHSIHNWALAEHMLAGELTMSKPFVPIDLHWNLHYSRQDRRQVSLDPEGMIERRRPVVVSGVPTWTLDNVDTLLSLAFHAARSDGHRLVWFKDIERVVATEPPDLDELVRRCREYRCAPPVGLMLRRTRDLLGAEIPAEVIRALVPLAIRSADRAVCGIVHPVQLHERSTPVRAFTRSVRSSVWASTVAVPVRVARSLRRSLAPPPANETDDPDEKAGYLRAVVASMDR